MRFDRVSVSTPLTMLRLAGLATWALIGIVTFADPTPVRLGIPAGVVSALKMTLVLGFGLAFWWNTRRIQSASPTRASVVLLLAQVPVALLVSPDLLVILAMEVPLVLTGRALVLWIGSQVALTAGLGIAISGSDNPWCPQSSPSCRTTWA